jgi:NAD(P)-dependent dehydrogenase (short-subunit alcohol dehydrogenase family)
MYDFKGKVALVTGVRSRRGLGHEIAVRFAKEGANVAFGSRKRLPEDFPEEEKAVGWKGLDSVLEEIEALGVRGLPIVADVTDEEQVQDMVDKTIAEFGRIDVVVANAGTGLMNRDMLTMSADDFRFIVNLNLTGAFLTARAGARHMVERGGGGSIVLISSTAAKVAEPHIGSYCPSKAGVIALGQVLAIELAEHNIRVNTICPGHFTTNLLAGQPAYQLSREKGITVAEAANEVLKDSYVKRILLKRVGYPYELANAVVFLASDEASFITGQDYNVDGGYTTG